MKKEIHPEYKKTKIVCACGNEFETRSTAFPEIKVELCSLCHPFYTGKQKFIDAAGRVDKFQARMKAAEDKKSSATKVKSKKAAGQKGKKNEVSSQSSTQRGAVANKEKLTEIKKDVDKGSTEGAQTPELKNESTEN